MARGRNVINQSIALEGGDEIVAMLRKMGEEGETAARKLEAAFRNVSVGKSFGSAFANTDTSPIPTVADQWRFELTPYMWAPGIKGTIGFDNGLARSADFNSSNVLVTSSLVA